MLMLMFIMFHLLAMFCFFYSTLLVIKENSYSLPNIILLVVNITGIFVNLVFFIIKIINY